MSFTISQGLVNQLIIDSVYKIVRKKVELHSVLT